MKLTHLLKQCLLNYAGPWSELDIIDEYNNHISLAYELAYKSMVLLKNDNDVLPLNMSDIILNKKSKYAFSLIGPCVNNTACYSGDYVGNPLVYRSPLMALYDTYGESDFIYVPGCKETSCTILEDRDVPDAVANSDYVIYIGGISTQQESEGNDRDIIELPPLQSELYKTVQNSLKNGQNIITILCYGTPVIDTFMFDTSDAILGSGYGGEMHGDAVVSLINGTNVPSGKTTITWYNNTRMLGNIDDYNMTSGYGKTYRYFNDTPIYSFGYGLSYTTFNYSDLKLSNTNIKACDSINVQFNVKNIGNTFIGDESSMVYLRILNNTYITTNIRLVNFTRNENIKPNDIISISLNILPKWMTVIDPYYFNELIIPGEYQVLIGGSMIINNDRSYPGFLKSNFNIIGNPININSC